MERGEREQQGTDRGVAAELESQLKTPGTNPFTSCLLLLTLIRSASV